ncbi:APA family fibronectin-binding glycoprotein [Nocardia sp. NPDC057668]|uniref:APA family fibronectin-binding glycoprotein n=1 Tax=Nocardia sp. NPDC057668 TaxID=3346202 RepID=UPI0036720DE4
MDPNQQWSPEPTVPPTDSAAQATDSGAPTADSTVSPRAARWIGLGCVAALIAAVAALGVLALGQWRDTRDTGAADRISSAAAGMSFVSPAGWEEIPPQDGELVFGQSALRRTDGADGMVLLGRLDQSLFAAAESDDARAACSLGGGMGEFFFPDSGQRIDESSHDLTGRGTTGKSCFYRVDFDDSGATTAEVYTAVVRSGEQRWWLTWLSDTDSPIDQAAAARLAESIRPL